MVNYRLKEFRKQLIDKKIDCAIFYKTDAIDDKGIKYLLEEKFNPSVFFVFSKKKPILFVSSLDKIDYKNPLLEGITIKIIDNKTKIYSVLYSEKVISLCEDVIPKKLYSKIKLGIKKDSKCVDFTLVDCDFLSVLREIKFDSEVTYIKKAVVITEDILNRLFIKFKNCEFKYEDDVVKFLKVECIKLGCETAFEPVVASGKNSSNPHYYSLNKSKLNFGFCVIDFGVKYMGYCSDITRTVYFGKPSLIDRNNYNLVLDGINYCEKNLVGNIFLNDFFTKFQKENFSMIHALGHGIGLDIHESPVIANSKIKSKEGIVVAIEPGLYFQNKFGIRIEDDFVLTKTGLKCLCKMNRDLRVFKL